jgi:gelsolin
MGEKVDKVVSPDRTATKVKEGSEPEEFWRLLGGKGPYTRDESVIDTPALSARLFHCSITPPSTKLEAEEVFNFIQEDLNEDDVVSIEKKL